VHPLLHTLRVYRSPRWGQRSQGFALPHSVHEQADAKRTRPHLQPGTARQGDLSTNPIWPWLSLRRGDGLGRIGRGQRGSVRPGVTRHQSHHPPPLPTACMSGRTQSETGPAGRLEPPVSVISIPIPCSLGSQCDGHLPRPRERPLARQPFHGQINCTPSGGSPFDAKLTYQSRPRGVGLAGTTGQAPVRWSDHVYSSTGGRDHEKERS